MKIARKLSLKYSAFVLSALLVSGTATVRADSNSDDAANFGVRGKRITSDCAVRSGVLIFPQVPPPPTGDPCQGKVLALDKSPNNRWSVDISWFDPDTQKLYLADRNNGGIDVFDTKNETAVAVASGFVGVTPLPPLPANTANASGPNGVLVTSNPHQLWAGDGNGDLRIYNLDRDGLPEGGSTDQPFAVVSHQDPVIVALLGQQGAQRRADELAYDPDDQLVLMAWDDDLDLFVALVRVSPNPNNIKVVKAISFKTNCPTGGCATAGIEQPVYVHDLNRFFIAIPASEDNPEGEIVRINPKTMAVDGAFKTTGTAPAVGVPCFPHGLTLGPRQNLLLGCSGDGPTGTPMISMIMRATTGTTMPVLQTFSQLGGSDEVYYDKGNNTYFLAMSSWTSSGKTGTGNPTPSLGIIDAGSSDSGNRGPEFIQNILTTRTSHSVAAGFGFRCEFDDHGRSHCEGDNRNVPGRNDDNKGNDIVRKHAYVPLTTVPIPLISGTPPTPQTLSEPGGIGIYGELP